MTALSGGLPTLAVQAAAPILQVQGLSEEIEVSSATPLIGAEAVSFIMEVEESYGVAMGFQHANGQFAEHGTLSGPQKQKIEELMKFYGNGNPAFRINLETLKDGDDNVLMPSGKSSEEFLEDMDALRDIAKTVLGLEKKVWKSYGDPTICRTIIAPHTGINDAFDTKHSIRLKDKLTFENEHLTEWLKKIREVKPSEELPSTATSEEIAKAKAENDTEAKAKERVRSAVLGFQGAAGLMVGINSAVKAQIGEMEKESKDPYAVGIHAEIAALKKLEGQLPVARVPNIPEKLKGLRESGQMTSRAVILYGASHSQEVKNLKSSDIEQMQADFDEHLNSFKKEKTECESRILPGRNKTLELTEENKETEKNFADSVHMLQAANRAEYENIRGALKAKETMDGAPVFYVQLSKLLYTAKSEEEIQAFVTGHHSETVFGSLEGKRSEGPCRQMALQAALKEYRAIQVVKSDENIDWLTEDVEHLQSQVSKALKAALNP